MAQRAVSAADITRNAENLARAITIGLRSWGFYPPEHPAVAAAVEKLVAVSAEATNAGMLQLAVTPQALLVDGIAIEGTDLSISECAALLHDRDILQITLISPPPEPVVRALLAMLTLDRVTRRAQGGPAAIWAAEPQTAVLIEQIDYQEILERDFDEGAARRDATWKAIVRSIIMRRKTFTEDEQQRLLEISRDVGAIGELAKDTKEAFCTPEGSPLITTQAATIIAVYRHIAKTVSALEPERAQDVMQSLALAASGLEPGTVFELLRHEETTDDALQIVSALKETFDDQQVATLLARAMAASGHPTSRLAQVLETIAPDDARKRRVLTLAKRLIGERDFGNKRPLDDIRRSLDELLLKYDESTYVSADYRRSMEHAGARAAELAARGLPQEIDQWLESLGHESVRRLSGQLLMDLLRNEHEPERAADTARDMGAFVEELLLTGAYADGVPVIDELAAAAARKPSLAPEACRQAIESVAQSTSFAEAATLVAEQTPAEFAAFEQLALAIGPPATLGLLSAYQREDGGIGADRTTALLVKFGPPAIPALAGAIEPAKWHVQRELARVLGQIGTAAAVPPLQALLRRSDVRVMQAAVASLARIDDPAALRALHTVLKATTGEARAAVIAALVGLKDARVVPLLARIVHESDPFSDDFPLLLETLSALSSIRDDGAVAHIAALARHRRWLAWGRTRQLREAALRTLARIGTAKARETLADLAKHGDFFLRRMAKAAAEGEA